MATINLGNIKFKWQGAYNGATGYTLDDVVSYNGSSYICIQASTGNLPTDTAYWEQMSQKGTDADLLTIAGTAQGDIYYNSGGAIAKLGAGTSGQFLKTLGTGANPAWADNTAGLISTGFNDSTTSHNITATSFTEITNSAFNVAMTSGQKIHLFPKVHGYQNTDDKADNISMFVTESGASEVNILSTATGSGGMGLTRTSYVRYWNTNAFDHGLASFDGWFTWTAQTTGTHSFTIKVYSSSGSSLNTQGTTVWYMITSV